MKKRKAVLEKLRAIRVSRSKRASAARRRRWGRWALALVAVLVVSLVGIGAFARYGYCTQRAGEDDLRDCAVDMSINAYRTLWGSPATSSDVTTAKGTVETESFESEALDRTIEYVVYLPPGYDDPGNASTRYPVVYLLPGSSGGTGPWVKAGEMAEQMDTLLADGQAQPMILVVPEESPGRFTPNTGYVDGPLGNWETYTTRDLVDEIDSDYRTVASAEGRAIAGLSEGGYGATNLGLKNPSQFGLIGSFSGYFTIDDDDLSRVFGGDRGLAEANSPMVYLPRLEGELPAIYFYVGQGERKNLKENQKFAEKLKARGASFDFETYPGKHNWDLWREHLSDFLVFASEHLTGGE
jgi:enterochelin esterase-like enzyme